MTSRRTSVACTTELCPLRGRNFQAAARSERHDTGIDPHWLGRSAPGVERRLLRRNELDNRRPQDGMEFTEHTPTPSWPLGRPDRMVDGPATIACHERRCSRIFHNERSRCGPDKLHSAPGVPRLLRAYEDACRQLPLEDAALFRRLSGTTVCTRTCPKRVPNPPAPQKCPEQTPRPNALPLHVPNVAQPSVATHLLATSSQAKVNMNELIFMFVLLSFRSTCTYVSARPLTLSHLAPLS